MPLVDRLLAGDIPAVARAISLVEETAPAAVDILREVFPKTGRATVVGLTGPPGCGKSSLVDRLVAAYRAGGAKVGVVAVDPSSAYSGGAILGDRVRMQAHATDANVFIRSMATRGCLGGLARSTNDAIDLLDAAGYDPILVETVGVGQDEVDVVRAADVVAVVLVPGMGDDIQAIKAGILEIADVFVINKADREGADRLEAELAHMMSLIPDGTRPRPAIHRTVATRDEGLNGLKQGLETFLQSARPRRSQRHRERARSRFLALLSERAVERIVADVIEAEPLERLVDEIAARRLDPYSAVDRVLSRLEVR